MQQNSNTQTRTYECVFHNFPTWIKENSDADEIIMKGIVTINELKKINTASDMLVGKTIDITNFDVEIENPYDEKEKATYTLFDYMCHDINDDRVNLLKEGWWFKVVANKHRATRFIIYENHIMSEDGKVYLQNKSAETIVIPENVDIIGDFAFTFLQNIRKIKMPEELDEIGNHAFYDLNDDSFFGEDEPEPAYTIIMPKRLKKFGEWAFECCDFHNLDIPEGIEIIPVGCFCYSFINKLTLPSTLKKIEGCGFMSNISHDIIIPEGVVTIEDCSIELRSNNNIHFPSTLVNIDTEFYYESLVGDEYDVPYITVDERNPIFYAKDGTLYKRDETKPYVGYEYKRFEDDFEDDFEE